MEPDEELTKPPARDMEIQLGERTILLKDARDLGNGLVSGTLSANGPGGVELHVTIAVKPR